MKKRKGTGSWGIPSLFVCRRIPGKGGKDVKCPGRKRSRGRPDTGGHPESRPVMEGKGEMATPMPSFAAIRRRILSKGAGELPKAIISPSFSVSFRSSHGLLEERGLRRQSLLGISFHVGRPRSVVRVPVCLEISPDPPVLLGSGVGKEAVEVGFRLGRAMKGRGVGRGMDRERLFRRGSPIPGKATAGSNCEERVSRLTKEFEVRRLPPCQGEFGGRLGC